MDQTAGGGLERGSNLPKAERGQGLISCLCLMGPMGPVAAQNPPEASGSRSRARETPAGLVPAAHWLCGLLLEVL